MNLKIYADQQNKKCLQIAEICFKQLQQAVQVLGSSSTTWSRPKIFKKREREREFLTLSPSVFFKLIKTMLEKYTLKDNFRELDNIKILSSLWVGSMIKEYKT